MPEEKLSLTNILSENWEGISKNLGLNLENRAENILLLMNYFRPILESASNSFGNPSVAVYVSVKKEYLKNILILEKMGFAKKEYVDLYGLTSEGVFLVEYYNKFMMKENKITRKEITNLILDNTESF